MQVQLSFAIIYPYETRKELSEDELGKCLSAWAAASRVLCNLSDDEFNYQITSNRNFVEFVRSYILNDDLVGGNDWLYMLHRPQSRSINTSLYRCLRRCTILGFIDEVLTPHTLVKLGALFFAKGSKNLLEDIWSSSGAWARKAVHEHILSISNMLSRIASREESIAPFHVAALQEISYLMMALADVSEVIFLDDLFFEQLEAAHSKLSMSRKDYPYPQLHTQILNEISRIPFTLVVAGIKQKRYSLVIDFLLNITTRAERNLGFSDSQRMDPRNFYSTEIASEIPLLAKLASVSLDGFENRMDTIIRKLNWLKIPMLDTKGLPNLVRRKRLSNNTKLVLESHHGPEFLATDSLLNRHMRNLSDLFPQTDHNTLLRRLQTHQLQIEPTIHSLLESEEMRYRNLSQRITTDREERSTELESQAGKFPDPSALAKIPDELDRLSVPESRLFMGKRNLEPSADALLSDRSTAVPKANILAALQNFESDDDERDDTYDLDDIGVGLDTSHADNEGDVFHVIEASEDEQLYKILVENPSVFLRNALTRRSIDRKRLRESTGLSDEAIEGWKLMLDRDGGKKLRHLEIRFVRDSRAQEQMLIPKSSYRKGGEEEDEEVPGISKPDLHLASIQSRATETPKTQISMTQRSRRPPKKKHNRKDQRARKVAKGGFPQ